MKKSFALILEKIGGLFLPDINVLHILFSGISFVDIVFIKASDQG